MTRRFAASAARALFCNQQQSITSLYASPVWFAPVDVIKAGSELSSLHNLTHARIALEKPGSGLLSVLSAIGLFATVLLLPSDSYCLPSYNGWLPWIRNNQNRNQESIIASIKSDPRNAVVAAYGLPLLSLAFGFTLSDKEMKAAESAVAPRLKTLMPWEIVVLLWGCAHAGYVPSQKTIETCKQQLLQALATSKNDNVISPQEAAMIAWSIAVIDISGQNVDLLKAAIGRLSTTPLKDLDEVALVIAFQAALFCNNNLPAAELKTVHTSERVVLPAQSSFEQVKQTLRALGASIELSNAAEAAYLKELKLPAFDGPILIELSLLRLVEDVWTELQTSQGSLYQKFFSDLRKVDLERARQLRNDKDLLQKLKREIADRYSQRSEYGRRLGNAARTLRELGVYSVVQTTVEDGLIAVDLALPDYKIVFFLEPPPSLLSSDIERAGLSGYATSDTAGSRKAKFRVLEDHGWVALPLSWADVTVNSDAERRHKIVALLEKAGREQLMKGRVNSVVYGALRGAADSELAGNRYGKASVGAKF